MVTTLLDRPNNVLTNRLGLGAPWKTLPFFYKTPKLYTFLNKIFLTNYFKILFKSGVIHANHTFFNKCFFYHAQRSLPHVVTEEGRAKFYRPVRLRVSTRFKARRNFWARRFLNFLNISELFFFRVYDFIVVTLYIYIPEPYKRFSYLEDLSRGSLKFYNKNDNAGISLKANKVKLKLRPLTDMLLLKSTNCF